MTVATESHTRAVRSKSLPEPPRDYPRLSNSAALRAATTRAKRQAFTLAEMVIVMGIFSLLVVALVSSQLFGLRMHRISESKLAATAEGRKALNHVRDEIRQGKIVLVGGGDAAGFTNTADGAPQIGNALQVHPTTNLSVFTRYYVDPGDNTLKQITQDELVPQVVARYVTNVLAFCAEDFQGNVLTNDDNNRVIRMTLEFYQWEYPVATVGSEGMYDYYRLQTRITRRLID